VNFLERQLEDPVRFKRVKRWWYVSLAVVALVEIVLPHLVEPEEAHFWFEDIPAWGALYGFISCVVIIVGSKFLGKLWLMRRENYYDS
jgi:hypothetical protein